MENCDPVHGPEGPELGSIEVWLTGGAGDDAERDFLLFERPPPSVALDINKRQYPPTRPDVGPDVGTATVVGEALALVKSATAADDEEVTTGSTADDVMVDEATVAAALELPTVEDTVTLTPVNAKRATYSVMAMNAVPEVHILKNVVLSRLLLVPAAPAATTGGQVVATTGGNVVYTVTTVRTTGTTGTTTTVRKTSTVTKVSVVSGSTTIITETGSDLPTDDTTASSGPSVGAIAGGVVGGLVAIGAIGMFVWRQNAKASARERVMESYAAVRPRNSPREKSRPPNQPFDGPQSPVPLSNLPSLSMGQSTVMYADQSFVKTGVVGMIPPAQQSQQIHWLFKRIAGPMGALNDLSVPYDGPALEATTRFDPNADDEMELDVGQYVELKDVFRDGWAMGWNRETGQFGMVPLSCLRLSDYGSPPQDQSFLMPPGPGGYGQSMTMSRFVSQSMDTHSAVLAERARIQSGTSRVFSRGGADSFRRGGGDNDSMYYGGGDTTRLTGNGMKVYTSMPPSTASSIDVRGPGF
ncbi:hypothetical protein HDU93_008781 [Gonapodya sp. JEL0774]|nr:hypothetical protein HDU93_008781 [Gonapodya sp. JEL0774]